MKQWKKALLAAIPMSLALSFSAFAGEWHLDMNGWWYENDDGSYLKNGWYWVDGNEDGIAECYYFGTKGYVANHTNSADGYSVNEDGAWVVDGVVQTKKVPLPNDSAAMALYLEAEKKNGELDSLDATVKAFITMEIDGEADDVGMDISMKMRGAKSGDLEYLMEGSMTMLGMDIPYSAFYTDGYIYSETMGIKTKQATDVYDAIAEMNSTMEINEIDVSAMTNMKMYENGSDTVITYSLDRNQMNEILDELVGTDMYTAFEELGISFGYDIARAEGEIVVDENGYYTKQTAYIDMAMTVTDLESGEVERLSYKVDMEININNPGEPAEFELPSTEGYTDISEGFIYEFDEPVEV